MEPKSHLNGKTFYVLHIREEFYFSLRKINVQLKNIAKVGLKIKK